MSVEIAGAVCHGIAHQAICRCPVGARGDPFVSCITIGCETHAECPSDKACINGRCESPCTVSDPCIAPSECRVHSHVADCSCPSGYIGTRGTGCKIGIESSLLPYSVSVSSESVCHLMCPRTLSSSLSLCIFYQPSSGVFLIASVHPSKRV
jgi:hypothetical protein